MRPLETEGFDLAGYNAISLALSLKSTGDVPAVQTKMTAAITQDGAGFRGIEQIYVVPFQTESAVPVGGGSTRLGDSNVQIHNPTIGQNGLVANNNSHLYDIVRVPLKTNRVLAYGKAFDSGSVATRDLQPGARPGDGGPDSRQPDHGQPGGRAQRSDRSASVL